MRFYHSNSGFTVIAVRVNTIFLEVLHVSVHAGLDSIHKHKSCLTWSCHYTRLYSC